MPKGPLKAQEVLDNGVTFFSIDTDLIQSAGYSFTSGALHQLPSQLPGAISLQLSEVVLEEIVNHRMRPVIETTEKFRSAVSTLARLSKVDFSEIETLFEESNVESAAGDTFRSEVRDYATSCRGGVLSIGGENAASELFESYFSVAPPFEDNAKKKSEFPDAMSLWLLDQYARNNGTKGIVASRDKGWLEFASHSEYLYHVGSIEELAELFVATGEHAAAIKTSITAQINDTNSRIRSSIKDALESHVDGSYWDASELYSGSNHRLDAEVWNAIVTDYTIKPEIKIWPIGDGAQTWVAELKVDVSVLVEVAVEFYHFDSIDREEVGIGSVQVTPTEMIELSVFLTCSEVNDYNLPDEWFIDTEIAPSDHQLDAFEVELDFGSG